MKLNIAICDDSKTDSEFLLDLLKSWAKEQNSLIHTEVFHSAEAFLFHYAEKKDYDILLLDVEMEKMSGIELAKSIRADNNRAEIIFVTSHFEFMGEGYEVDALHYLVKPISKTKLMSVLSKVAEKLSVDPPSVIITCNGETVKLYESDILYVESFLHYLVLYTKGKEYKIKEGIAAFELKLTENFFRVHRSYLVSLKAIKKITRTSVIMDGNTEIPIARGNYDKINRAFIEQN